MSEESRKPKDRDFLRTREGLFFCVTGYLHPPNRYTAYLKYSPGPTGKWADDRTAYRRELPYYHVRNVAKTIRYLEGCHPQYVHDCPVRGFRFSMVPRQYVDRYYEPERRLEEILARPEDLLEEEARGLAMEIATCAGIDPGALGITGSILIGLHDPAFSDVDLTVYGLENAQRVRRALARGQCPRTRRLDEAFVAQWALGIAERFPLSLDEARTLAGRRWNYGFYGERYFSIHPTRSDAEITERYGEHVYRGRGVARVRALVVDAAESLFMPAIYRVREVRVLEGEPAVAASVGQVVSYEGLYRDVVDAGQWIEARGKLETVDGEPRRLVIGTMAPGEEGYVKPSPSSTRSTK